MNESRKELALKNLNYALQKGWIGWLEYFEKLREIEGV
jgi:hypothetical protein